MPMPSLPEHLNWSRSAPVLSWSKKGECSVAEYDCKTLRIRFYKKDRWLLDLIEAIARGKQQIGIPTGVETEAKRLLQQGLMGKRPGRELDWEVLKERMDELEEVFLERMEKEADDGRQM